MATHLPRSERPRFLRPSAAPVDHLCMATSTTPRPDSGTSPARSTARKTKSSSKRLSRAVVRDVEAGSQVDCPHCGERVKFQAKMRNKQVICNIYVRGQWNRVEHYHLACYLEAGSGAYRLRGRGRGAELADRVGDETKRSAERREGRGQRRSLPQPDHSRRGEPARLVTSPLLDEAERADLAMGWQRYGRDPIVRQ